MPTKLNSQSLVRLQWSFLPTSLSKGPDSYREACKYEDASILRVSVKEEVKTLEEQDLVVSKSC